MRPRRPIGGACATGARCRADDFVQRPLDAAGALDRVEVHSLIRQAPAASAPLRLGTAEIDPIEHQAHVLGQELDLTPTEFRLFRRLVEKFPGLVTSDELLNYVLEGHGHPCNIRFHVQRLREKLRVAGSDIEITTTRGQGYAATTDAPCALAGDDEVTK